MDQDKIKKIAIGVAAVFVAICCIAVGIKANIADTASDEELESTEDVEAAEDTDTEEDTEADEEESSSSTTTSQTSTSELQTESELLASLDWFDETHDWRELDLPTITSTLRGYSWFNADTQTVLTIRYYRIDDADLANDYTYLYAYSVDEAWLDRDLGVTVASLYINDYEESASVDPDIAETIIVTISPTDEEDEANTSSSPLRLDVEYGGDLEFAASTYYAIERTS